MGIKKILYVSGNGKSRLTKATATFFLLTESGETMKKESCEVDFPDNKMFVHSTGEFFEIYDAIRALSENKKVKKEMNLFAESLLKEYREEYKGKDEIVLLSQGALVKGKHIVKCTWKIDIDDTESQYMTYEEYQFWKQGEHLDK